MSQPIVIGSLSLPRDLAWIDEFDAGSDLVRQQETVTLTGALIVQASAQQAGRAMTLQTTSISGNQFCGSLTRAQVIALKALADVPGATYALTFSDGRTFTVMFRRGSRAAVAATRQIFMEDFSGDEFYSVVINLILV